MVATVTMALKLCLRLGTVLLWMEDDDDDVDLWHVQHSQRDRGAQAKGHSQCGGLDAQVKGRVDTTPRGGINDR